MARMHSRRVTPNARRVNSQLHACRVCGTRAGRRGGKNSSLGRCAHRAWTACCWKRGPVVACCPACSNAPRRLIWGRQAHLPAPQSIDDMHSLSSLVRCAARAEGRRGRPTWPPPPPLAQRGRAALRRAPAGGGAPPASLGPPRLPRSLDQRPMAMAQVLAPMEGNA